MNRDPAFLGPAATGIQIAFGRAVGDSGLRNLQHDSTRETCVQDACCNKAGLNLALKRDIAGERKHSDPEKGIVIPPGPRILLIATQRDDLLTNLRHAKLNH